MGSLIHNVSCDSPPDFVLIAWGTGWAMGSLKSSAGDSNVQSKLRSTELNKVVRPEGFLSVDNK